MKTVLVTGPIGGGKSSVCRHLAEAGYPVYDCDSRCKALYGTVPGLKERIESELGIPFSDPTAEGPVIQGANIRALAGGVTTDKIFAFVRELRKDVSVPLVFMTYANVVFSYGIARFAAACEENGIDGLILPDVPHEEKEEFAPLLGAL